MQSLHLQILEKWSQQFDGVVGQDNRQHPKTLVTGNKTTQEIAKSMSDLIKTKQ